jgi:hypothetical protein
MRAARSGDVDPGEGGGEAIDEGRDGPLMSLIATACQLVLLRLSTGYMEAFVDPLGPDRVVLGEQPDKITSRRVASL